MKKKLLFLTHVGAPGGAEYKMMGYCKSSTYSSKVIHFQSGPLEEELKQRNIASKIIPMPTAMTTFTKDDGIKAALKSIPSALSMLRSLIQESKKHDVIVCFSQKSFILSSLAKPFVRKPIIWFMNDILSQNYFSKAVVVVIKISSKISANHIVLNSQASFDAWKNSGATITKTSIIHPSVNIERFDKELEDRGKTDDYKRKFSPNGKPLVGIFGRISPWKGQDVFLKAIAQVENVNAIIVGDSLFGETDYKASLIELTKSLNIEDRVIFVGHSNDVPNVMACCDIVAHCSTLAEPFGLVTAEATVARTPVIATNAGGSREIIKHKERGQLTPMGDENALADAINFYLENPEQAKEFAAKAREYTEQNFSTSQTESKFISILEKI